MSNLFFALSEPEPSPGPGWPPTRWGEASCAQTTITAAIRCRAAGIWVLPPVPKLRESRPKSFLEQRRGRFRRSPSFLCGGNAHVSTSAIDTLLRTVLQWTQPCFRCAATRKTLWSPLPAAELMERIRWLIRIVQRPPLLNTGTIGFAAPLPSVPSTSHERFFMGDFHVEAKLLSGVAAISIVMAGCSFELPEIARDHPANLEAPAGQQYAVPAALEVRPFIRPPDKPVSQPSGSVESETSGSDHMDGMNHGETHDQQQPGIHPSHRDRLHAAPHGEGRSNWQMQQEGQRDE